MASDVFFLPYFIGYNHYGFWCVFYLISLVITTMASDVFFLPYFIGYNHYGREDKRSRR
jgi:hypothetical protein